MVCDRCKTAVKNILEQNGLHPEQILLGEVKIKDAIIDKKLETNIQEQLQAIGFDEHKRICRRYRKIAA